MKCTPLPYHALDAAQELFWSKVDVRGAADCWEWQSTRNHCGYGLVTIAGHRWIASRIAMAIVGRDVPTDKQACHHCDNPPCCNPMHLFTATMSENMADKVAKGRTARGRMVSQKQAVLNDDAVRHIRRSRLSLRALGRMYGVSSTSIRYAKIGRTWRYVEDTDVRDTSALASAIGRALELQMDAERSL